MAVALKRCLFYPMLEKPNWVWEVVVFFLNCNQTTEKLLPFKPILALPPLGQICNVSVPQSFLSDFLQTEHHISIFPNFDFYLVTFQVKPKIGVEDVYCIEVFTVFHLSSIKVWKIPKNQEEGTESLFFRPFNFWGPRWLWWW